MIKITNLYHKYVKEYYALYDITLQIAKGEKVALVGDEDSGKTSLIRIIAKLENFCQGEIYINNKNLKEIDYKTDISVGYVPVCPIFFENKTVYQNLEYVLKIRKFSQQEIEEKINDTLKKFDIQTIALKKIKHLSVYEKYIVSFARLHLRHIDIILVDSIFDNLEPQQVQTLLSFAKFCVTPQTTVILATSDKEIAKFCDKSIYFKLGSVVENLD